MSEVRQSKALGKSKFGLENEFGVLKKTNFLKQQEHLAKAFQSPVTEAIGRMRANLGTPNLDQFLNQQNRLRSSVTDALAELQAPSWALKINSYLKQQEHLAKAFQSPVTEAIGRMRANLGTPNLDQFLNQQNRLANDVREAYAEAIQRAQVGSRVLNSEDQASDPGESLREFKEVPPRLHSLKKPGKVLNRKSVTLPPGTYLKVLSMFFFSKKIHEEVFLAILADANHEYNEALFKRRAYKAGMVRLQLYWMFWNTFSSLFIQNLLPKWVRKLVGLGA